MSDEAIRKHVPAAAGRTPEPTPAPPARRLVELDRAQAVRLLGSVPLGRVVFTHGAPPAIRPVNHLLHHDVIIIRTHLGAAIATAANAGVVVAYEADHLDPTTHLGWSVVVTGRARPVTDPQDVADYHQHLHPWIDTPMDHTIQISSEMVTGFTLLDPQPPPPHAPPV